MCLVGLFLVFPKTTNAFRSNPTLLQISEMNTLSQLHCSFGSLALDQHLLNILLLGL